MAMLSRGPPKDRDYDGESRLSQQQRRNLGDLGEAFPKLRKDVDLANGDRDRIRKLQKYLKENMITGIQNQMRILTALKLEGVVSDRVHYACHTLIVGNGMGKNLNDPFAPMTAQPDKLVKDYV